VAHRLAPDHGSPVGRGLATRAARGEDGGTGYERGAVRLELTFLVRDESGSIFTPLRHGQATWPEEALRDDVGELQGVRSRLVELAFLTYGKSSPRDDPEDAAKDRADFNRLSDLPLRTSQRIRSGRGGRPTGLLYSPA
jgi:hypothetical protein